MGKRVTVADLKDQIGSKEPRPFLYCRKCGAEYSANSGDYWNLPAGHVFKCCRANMMLALKHTVYEEAN